MKRKKSDYALNKEVPEAIMYPNREGELCQREKTPKKAITHLSYKQLLEKKTTNRLLILLFFCGTIYPYR